MNIRMLCLSLLLAAGAGCSRPADSAPSHRGREESLQAPAEAGPNPARVELKLVNYDQLTAAIREQRGKVVVVDIWASWCGPCKVEFPHLVELHQKHAKEGLVCMSVSVDDDEAKHAAALKFLTKVNATFANYRVEDSERVWQDKWDFKGLPAVYVFDRQGRQAGKLTNDDPDNQFTYARDVEPLVRKLLKAP